MILNIKPLYMHRLHFDASKIFNFLKNRLKCTTSSSTDLDYALHSILKELFGVNAPQPFYIRGFFGNVCELLGYNSSDLKTLKDYATMFADPALHELVIWDDCAEKQMPDNFKKGDQINFEARICPIKRSRNTNIQNNKPEGQLREYDAYLSYQDKTLDRGLVYGEWMTRILEERGGVKVIKTWMDRYAQKEYSLQRRDQSRKLTSLGSRPDVTMCGHLEIVDPLAFQNIIRTGFGRHKAFGFGMLLLKPTVRD